jgi:aldehyde:ferredoxin oxidoreductase
MQGYKGKILTIDLGVRSAEAGRIPASWYTDFVGGEGFAAKILYDELSGGEDPLGDGNILVFATGPLTGTKAPTGGRLIVGFKSPLSGTIGLSNVGGHIAPMIKKAGYDVIVVKGKSSSPVYLHITETQVEFKDARHLWGLDTEATETAIRRELGNDKVRIAQAGPAGEKLARISSIMVDAHRAVGRGGAGAVMGSKKLKALVCYGTTKLEVHNDETLDEFAAKARKELEEEAFVRDELKPFGTPSFTDSINALGLYPTKNWKMTTFDAMDTLGHQGYHETLDVKKWACAGCPIGCGRHTTIKSGAFKGDTGGGPEYETVGALGAKCMVRDINAIAEANYICNRAGLDTISTGQTIATAMEWYEKGIIDKKTTGGIELCFGDGEAMIAMVRQIAAREGFGDVLAEGSVRAAIAVGGDAAASVMAVKGLEMAACGVNASKGEALSYLISARGGDHLRPYASAIDAFGYLEHELGIDEKVSPFEDGNKYWVKALMELSMLTNMLGVCLFTVITLAVKGSTWTGLYNAATGEKATFKDLLLSAERVLNLERMFNAREGFDRKDDALPARLTDEPAIDGLGKGQVVNVDIMLDEFYTSMGWDLKTGLPGKQKLKQLGLA